MKVAVINYGIGNVRSICNALSFEKLDFCLTNNKEELLNADALILPGVGAFKHGMQNLKENNLIVVIEEFIKSGKPFIGICLGMQMLMETSEEFGLTKGLGLIKGNVIQLSSGNQNFEKIPHVGWKTISNRNQLNWENTLLQNTGPENSFYFVHSFVAVPENQDDVLATAEFGGKHFCAAIKHKNIYGFQFHPEKSGRFGLLILRTLKDI